jgi:hypothetical protein
MEFYEKLASLPEEASKLVLSIGNNRQRLRTVRRWEYIPEEGELLDELEDQGFGLDYQYARLIVRDEKGRQIRSLSFKEALEKEEESKTESHISTLVNGILSMASEQRRFLATLNTTLQQREAMMSSIIDKLMESREEVMQERTNALALDLALQDSEKENAFNYKERALETLATLGQQYLSNQRFNVQDIKKMLIANPEILDAMMEDEEVWSLLTSKFSGSTSDSKN